MEVWRNGIGDKVVFIDDEYVIYDGANDAGCSAISIAKEKEKDEFASITLYKTKYSADGFFPVDRPEGD